MLPALLIAAAALFGVREGTLTYTVVHKLHEVKGTSRSVEGRAALADDGMLRVQVRAPLASFDSGNSNRDEHMREVTHEPLHPYVQLKGSAQGAKTEGDVTLAATVELNGIKKEQPVTVHLAPQGDAVHATFTFTISLDAFQVERPELLLVKVDDQVRIDGDLVFAKVAQ